MAYKKGRSVPSENADTMSLPKQEPYDGTAETKLPKQSARQIQRPCLYPCGQAGLFEHYRGDQTHDRAHDAADAKGDGRCDEGRPIVCTHEGKSDAVCERVRDEQFEQKCDRRHDDELMKRLSEYDIAHLPKTGGNVVDDHAIGHEDGHDGSKDDTLKSVLRHNFLLVLYSCVVLMRNA